MPEAPFAFQIQFMLDEIKRQAPQHPEWENSALLKAIMNDDVKKLAKLEEDDLTRLLAMTHNGISVEEYSTRVQNWLNSHNNARFGCRYDQLANLPMVQLLNYLRANGFKTWIVASGGVDFVRVMSEKMYGIPAEQVVGSFSIGEFTITQDGAKVIKTMKGPFTDDSVNKPVAIHLFMGQRPVAAFGNSDADLSMLRYNQSTPGLSTLAMLIHHTDSTREYAYGKDRLYSGKLSRGLYVAKEEGWPVIDMRKDWKTIFDPKVCPELPDP